MERVVAYAKADDDVSIAYQVLGDGPMDLVVVWGYASHVEVFWEDPRLNRLMRRLASFCRLITFDKRGTGMSDPVEGAPTLEQRMDDVRVVMDAVGSERAALLGDSEGGPMSALFAATYPDRVSALIIWGSFARGSWAEDYPWGMTLEKIAEVADALVDGWGQGITLDFFTPSLSGDAALRASAARFERMSASPAMARKLALMAADCDVRDVLSVISAPTLIAHGEKDSLIPVEQGRDLAARIPGATYVELAGAEHDIWALDADRLGTTVEEFLTGVRSPTHDDRVLATILFTDIVESTQRAVEMGDARWRYVLEQHDAVMRRQVETFRGRAIKSTGDGFLVCFDGPGRALACARAAVDAVRSLGIDMRAGLHTGECEVIGDDLGGVAVHVAARIVALAGAGEILVSRTVQDLVAGSGYAFADAGTHRLKGLDGTFELRRVLSR